MIDRKNYFVATAAEFRAIPSKWARALLRGGKVRLGNQTFVPDYVSGKDEDPYSGIDKSLSAYWVSADGSTLIRVSDHWCGATRELKRCHSIRSCLWRLRGKPRLVYHDGLRLAGGIVRFRDMRG